MYQAQHRPFNVVSGFLVFSQFPISSPNRYSSFIYLSVRLSYGDGNLPNLTSVRKQLLQSPLVLFISRGSSPCCSLSKRLFLLIFRRTPSQLRRACYNRIFFYTKVSANRAIFPYYLVCAVDLRGKHRANGRVWSMKTENAPNRLRQSHY